MFKKFLNNIESIVREIAERKSLSFNERLETFNDPFAKEVEWEPAKNGGVGFRTRTMVTSGNETIKLRPSFPSLAISIGSLIIGFWLITISVTLNIPTIHNFSELFSVGYFVYYQVQNQISIEMILGVLFGLVFLILGLLCIYKLLRPVKFDRYERSFSRGYPFFRKTIVPFNDIKAIQIISEYCKGSNSSSYRSYELNLILNNKSRVTVVDHSDIYEIRRNGEEISKMLSVPVWDMTKT